MSTEPLFYINFLNQRLELDPQQDYIIGRSQCDILLPHYLVSRQHARLNWINQALFITDLSSTNGTLVNNQTIHHINLNIGDRIEIGGFHLTIDAITDQSPEISQPPSPDDTLTLNRVVASLLQDIQDPVLANRITHLKNHFDQHRKNLTDLAFKDELTSLYNRRFFDKQLTKEMTRAQRYHRSLHLIMADIDHFKQFNDNYGHQKGDLVLQTVAQIIANNCRENDTVARYGGEEISIILPETSMAIAQQVAEKIRKKVQQEAQKMAAVPITISLGIAGLNATNSTTKQLINAADTALYQAKHQGRNQVCIESAHSMLDDEF